MTSRLPHEVVMDVAENGEVVFAGYGKWRLVGAHVANKNEVMSQLEDEKPDSDDDL